MARLCERPGCSTPADVAYGFDAEQLTVWLDAFHTAQGARSGVLCRRHADAMVVPLGWMLDDRREPVPRLFKSAETAVVRERPRRTRSVHRDDTEQLRLVDDGASTAVAPEDRADDGGVRYDDGSDPVTGEVVDEPDATEALPWQPHFDQTDDLHGLLNARGRLLSRAFTGTVLDES